MNIVTWEMMPLTFGYNAKESLFCFLLLLSVYMPWAELYPE